MIQINKLPYKDFDCLKQPKNELKAHDNTFQRMLKNEIKKLQTEENYK